jgi:hypothetical protein
MLSYVWRTEALWTKTHRPWGSVLRESFRPPLPGAPPSHPTWELRITQCYLVVKTILMFFLARFWDNFFLQFLFSWNFFFSILILKVAWFVSWLKRGNLEEKKSILVEFRLRYQNMASIHWYLDYKICIYRLIHIPICQWIHSAISRPFKQPGEWMFCNDAVIRGT